MLPHQDYEVKGFPRHPDVAPLAGMKRRKPKAQRKEDSIRIRVSNEQKTALVEAADRAGLDVSSWLRSIGLREAGGDLADAAARGPRRQLSRSRAEVPAATSR